MQISNLAYAIDGFFTNGGKRCYISRVYSIAKEKFAKAELESGEGKITINTVGPGDWGNRVYYKVSDSSLHYKADDNRDSKFFKISICYFSNVPEKVDDESCKRAA